MKTYDLAVLTKRVMEARGPFFTASQLSVLLEISKESSLFKVVQRLLKAGLLVRVERNKYARTDSLGNHFGLANFLYEPSYVSFESALSHWGILSQFPVEVTSATVKLSRRKKFARHIYCYYRLQKVLYWGYLKENGYLIAEPEKAILDQIYLATKGLKSLALEEYDLTGVSLSKLKSYVRRFPAQVGNFFAGVKL